MKKYFNILRKYVIITIGTLIVALALDIFLIPAKLAAGGISGLATVLHHLLGVNTGVLIFVFNIPIFAAGILVLGRKFGISSLYAIVTLSLFLNVFADAALATEDLFLQSIFGGLMSGTGLGIVFSAGATTGGTDIVAKLLQRKWQYLPLASLLLLADACVIVFATLAFKNLYIGLYSAVALFVSSKVIDTILEGANFAKMVFVISDHHEDIARRIMDEMERGVTGIYSRGMYLGSDKMMLICIVKRFELPRLKRLVRDCDREAFVMLSDAREVLGEGFGNYEFTKEGV